MNAIRLSLCLMVAGVLPASAMTAYEALQVVKKARGESVLNQLVEVRGEAGRPQPQSWTVLMNDPAARSGIREFVVTGGEIASERTPLRGFSASDRPVVLNFTRLNLDSDGAFRVANQEAAKAQTGFNSLNYQLRNQAAGGSPIWTLHLFDHMGAPVGQLEVSAETGKVVSDFVLDADAREKPRATPVPPAVASAGNGGAPADEEEITTYFPGGVFGFVERTTKQVGRAVKRTSLNVAGTVQQVLTGERTIGEEEKAQPSN